MDPRLRAAVDSSARWYDELFALHGIGHHRAEGLWRALGPPPPLHSAAKSLQPWARSDQALAAVAAYPHCGIADSFATLNLPGFELLFAARWLFREPDQGPNPLPAGWSAVRTHSQLREWTEQHDTTDVLLPGLLDQPGFTVLGRREHEQLVAGAVLHAAAGVVSLSNVWSAADREPDWPELARVAHAVHPGLAIVGYEHGDDLERALAAGFRDVGPQLVWHR